MKMSLFLLFSKAKANFLNSKAFLSKIWVFLVFSNQNIVALPNALFYWASFILREPLLVKITHRDKHFSRLECVNFAKTETCHRSWQTLSPSACVCLQDERGGEHSSCAGTNQVIIYLFKQSHCPLIKITVAKIIPANACACVCWDTQNIFPMPYCDLCCGSR